MFRNLSSQLAAAATGNNAEAKKVLSPTLRSDIYSAVDQAKSWITGGRGQAGDGVSYGVILSTIQKHFPQTKLGLESVGHAESEVAVIVGGITNMVMEYSKWESMSGGMAMRTWVDGLVDAYGKANPGARKDMIAKGITRGINQNTDVSLMTKDFTARIQIISCLKTGKSGNSLKTWLHLMFSFQLAQGSTEVEPTKPARVKQCGVRSSSEASAVADGGGDTMDMISCMMTFFPTYFVTRIVCALLIF